MLNLITTISVGCFDSLNRGGKTLVYENNDGKLIIENKVITEYSTDTSTYILSNQDEIDSIIAYLKNSIFKIPYIPVLKRHTTEIKKII